MEHRGPADHVSMPTRTGFNILCIWLESTYWCLKIGGFGGFGPL